MAKLPSSLNEITINWMLKLSLTRQNCSGAIARKWYRNLNAMLGTPDSYLSPKLDGLYGHSFSRYRQICDPTLRSGCHRVLMVIAITDVDV